MITAERLRELLDYDPDSGLFTWKIDRPRAKKGDTAGCVAIKLDGRRYLVIRISQKNYYAHRLAVLWMTGEFPDFLIDHRNGNGLNNSWDNLRLATDSQNSYNSKRNAGRSGYRGVWYEDRSGRYVAVISHEGKRTNLGTYDTAEEAARVWDREAKKNRDGFAVLNFPEMVQ